MLHEFLEESRDRIIARTRTKVAGRPVLRPTETELRNGIPLFLTQLVGRLQQAPSPECSAEIGTGAARHGDELLRMGFSVEQVVHDYGGLCQAITEIALEDDIPITTTEFKTLNGCLDDAIASAVSEFGRQREQSVSDAGVKHIGFLAHELLNALHVAMIAFDAIRAGTVGASGSTGAMLGRNLDRMRELIDRSLAEVGLKGGTQKWTPVSVATLIEELSITAECEAKHRGLEFVVEPVPVGMAIDADQHLLTSALTNLLLNAFKFTRPHSRVTLRTLASADHVRIEVEDQCGGLLTDNGEGLFHLFGHESTERSGLGLGLEISRRAVQASGGTIDVRDLPGRGCVFSVDLARRN